MNVTTQHEEEIFDAARRMADPAARDAFLRQACAGNATLRTRLDRLLAVAPEADRFFAEGGTALSVGGAPLHSTRGTHGNGNIASTSLPGEEQIGTLIGRYKLLKKIGEGGCGVVYMAEQQEPVRRRVALKIIKLGMETKSVISRFEAERQALAMMDQTNIARVFDAGATERGSPYFVMELVSGVKITDYCDQNGLDVLRRLHLFIQICHAIQHAHQKGVIHRDIKPSNIIVTLQDGTPVPKVIDFGIAKATQTQLTDQALLTANAQLIGTPAYMSPEQAELGRVDIDTRSDIYSLGVLFYELVTGRTPFDAKALLDVGLDELRRILRETEPPRPSRRLQGLPAAEAGSIAAVRQTDPSQLTSLLRGDLDWIAMKALEKDRTRRYETANGLASDVQRHLNHEPVLARPPSRLYRFQKLARRNRVVFAAGAAVLAALVAGLGTSTWLYLKEREARSRAVAAEQQQARLRREAEVRQRITQAALLVSQDHVNEADKILGEISLTQPTVEGAAVLRSVGEWHAMAERWLQAADRFTLLSKVDSFDGMDVATLDSLRLGPALIELRDIGRYERFRQETLALYPAATCPYADRILKICLLVPPPAASLDTLAKFAEATTKSITAAEAENDAFRAAWHAVALALWDYRTGNYAKAIEWCERCLACPENNPPRSATAQLVLAMACQQLSRVDEARAAFAAGREIVESKYRSHMDRGSPVQGFWFDWDFARILFRESAALVDPPNHLD